MMGGLGSNRKGSDTLFYQWISLNTDTEATLGRGETLDSAGESYRHNHVRTGLYSSAVVVIIITLKQKGSCIMQHIAAMNVTTPASPQHKSKERVGGECFTTPLKGGGVI